MNKKQGDQMQFSLRKKTRKKKMNSSNPSYQSMDCVIKWGNWFIISIRIFFICLKPFIMQLRKNNWDKLKECEEKLVALQLRFSYNICSLVRYVS